MCETTRVLVKEFREQYDPVAAKARLEADHKRVEKIQPRPPLPKINTIVEKKGCLYCDAQDHAAFAAADCPNSFISKVDKVPHDLD